MLRGDVDGLVKKSQPIVTHIVLQFMPKSSMNVLLQITYIMWLGKETALDFYMQTIIRKHVTYDVEEEIILMLPSFQGKILKLTEFLKKVFKP